MSKRKTLVIIVIIILFLLFSMWLYKNEHDKLLKERTVLLSGALAEVIAGELDKAKVKCIEFENKTDSYIRWFMPAQKILGNADFIDHLESTKAFCYMEYYCRSGDTEKTEEYAGVFSNYLDIYGELTKQGYVELVDSNYTKCIGSEKFLNN